MIEEKNSAHKGVDRAKRIKMIVEMEVTQAQGLALQAMFKYWNYLASVGSSRKVAFVVDGDGNFRPKCSVKFEGEIPELTEELRDLAVVGDDDGDLIFDFDPVAWKIYH